MVTGTDRGEILHPVEVELLCVFAEVVAPFPLEVPSSGVTELERVVMFQGARELMTERGLADENGPLGVADDFVYLLRNATGVLDLVLAEERQTMAAVVLAYREEALLVTQDLADPDRMIRMAAATIDEAVDALVRLVPRLDAAATAPFSLPRKAIAAALGAMRARMPEPDLSVSDVDTTVEIRQPQRMSTEEIDDLLRAHGIDERLARKMVTQLQPVLGNGQAGLARRDDTEDQWRRVGDEIRWLDTRRGRFRLAEDGDWMSVNPFTADDLRSALRTLAATIRT
jgi:ESAT-6 protein secretion system EspG family protein